MGGDIDPHATHIKATLDNISSEKIEAKRLHFKHLKQKGYLLIFNVKYSDTTKRYHKNFYVKTATVALRFFQ